MLSQDLLFGSHAALPKTRFKPKSLFDVIVGRECSKVYFDIEINESVPLNSPELTEARSRGRQGCCE